MQVEKLQPPPRHHWNSVVRFHGIQLLSFRGHVCLSHLQPHSTDLKLYLLRGGYNGTSMACLPSLISICKIFTPFISSFFKRCLRSLVVPWLVIYTPTSAPIIKLLSSWHQLGSHRFPLPLNIGRTATTKMLANVLTSAMWFVGPAVKD